MKFLRHILSHIMFIILLAGVIGVYYFRNQVLPESYVNKINIYAEKIHPDLVSIASTLEIEKIRVSDDFFAEKLEEKIVVNDVPAAEPELVVKEVEKQDVAVVEINPVEVKPVETKEEVVKSVQEKIVVSVIEPEVVTIKEDKKADEKVEAVSVAVKPEAYKKVETAEEKNINKEFVVLEVPVDEDKKMAAKTEVTAVVDHSLTSDNQAASYKEILNIARREFSKSNFEVSVNKYKELIELEDHEADFHGELGNVYYAMGNWSKAGEAYYEAAQRLMVKGNVNQAIYLQRVLQSLDAERAGKLARQIANLSQNNVSTR